MKKLRRHIRHGMEVGSEKPAKKLWERPVSNQYLHIMRNTGRIEQLEAGQDDVKKKVEYILTYLQSSPWTSPKTPFSTAYLSWRGLRDMPDTIFELEEGLRPWTQAPNAKEMLKIALEPLTPPYSESLSRIKKFLGELEEDFDDIARRITRCAILEEELAAFENSLDVDETEYLGWCVSLIRDVLDYNYAEELTKKQLDLLKKGTDLIYKKGQECNKEDYQNLHKEFLQSGLALIPTTQKAIDKYGE